MIPALLLVLLAVTYRLVTGLMITSGAVWLSNFAPMAGIALCCAAYFPPKWKFTVPLGALFLSDVILNYRYGASFLDAHIVCRYLALTIVGAIGLLLQNRASLKTLLPGALAGSVVFYVMTNAFSWLSDPGYAKTLAGLWQALTVGLPQYSATPAWMFFRNSLLSDLFFTFLFVLCIAYGRSSQATPTKATLARTA